MSIVAHCERRVPFLGLNRCYKRIYHRLTLRNIDKYTKFLLIFNILALSGGIVLSLVLSQDDKEDYNKFMGMFYIILSLLILLIIETVLYCVLSTKCPFIKRVNITFNFFTLCSIFVLIRYIIYYSKFTNDFIHVFFYFDFLIKFIWIELTLIDFYENLIINVFIIVLSKLIQSLIFGWGDNAVIYVAVGDVLRVSSVTFAYFISKKFTETSLW